MNLNSADLALFKLAGDTADLMVAQSSRFGNASQNLHNQLDIPDRRIARSSESLPALRGYKQNSVRTHHHGSADQQHDSTPPGQDSSDAIQSRHAVTENPSAATALPTSHLTETPVKKKRGRPPKVRPQEVLQPSAETSPASAPAKSVPEVVFAHRSEIPTKRINFIANPSSDATAEKNASARSTRLAADGISYRQLAGTREYRKRHESEGDDQFQSSGGVLKRKYKKRDKHSEESIRGSKHSKYHVQTSQLDPEQRTKRKYVKKSSKWKTLTQNSQLREEMFLRAPNRYDTIRTTASRFESSRPTHISSHHEDAYAGIPMPPMLHHDAHMAHMGMPPGHMPGYPMHPYMMPQFVPMHHPYAFGRYGYEYGPPPSITSMYSPRDGEDPYSTSHPGMPVPVAFVHHAPASQMRDANLFHGNQRPTAPVPRVSSAAFRQQSSLGLSTASNHANPIPDMPNDHEALIGRRSDGASAAELAERGSLRRNRISSDSRSSQFLEVVVPNQPASAIALLPPLTETSAFRHISKNHDEITAQRRRRHKLDKLASGKPVSATSENGSMLSQPPVSLVNNDSDVYDLRQVAPCSCKWTRSSYEQVLAQADALLLSTIAQGKSASGAQGDLTETAAVCGSAAPLTSCLAEPASDSAVSFALKLQEEGRPPQVVAEFITATLTLLKRELSSLNHATISYSKSSEKFHQIFDSEWKQAVSVLNARAPIPEEFFSRIAADTHANSGEVAGRENRKVLWELFHQKMNDIVVAKNGLDVVVEGMKCIHKMGKSLPAVQSSDK